MYKKISLLLTLITERAKFKPIIILQIFIFSNVYHQKWYTDS